MRTEKEMFQLILDTAKNDSRILAVGLNGSRTNKAAPRDLFQDYDVVYVVESVEDFVKETAWIDKFGSRLIMQTPEDMTLFPPTGNGRFTYLMLFEDGNRIDLTLCPKEQANTWNEGDRLAEVLLDKNHILPNLSVATDQDYWVKQPSQAEFSDCCNEFWWVSTYVVKGLYRNELFYAADHLNEICQKELLRLLSWYVAGEIEYKFSVGKNYKYLPNYLSEEQYQAILRTMNIASIPLAWDALISLQNQFDYYAQVFSKKNNLVYDQNTAEKVKDYTKVFRLEWN
ncbi:aminoglycoside 6-adenylyltransferase [Enterococcus caccae]|uniref:Aminoglycoside 6-adenylyltransferase n=1 Tax=Enterococcus caccae ATCC BAA-1240 TaxID=1158612 RepID=R3W5H5_9ENTE|nr:aminoglycoside 6-adenylyltransferase [Enterococcus caccae]EOL42871.1 hypothetical protein UC7_03279 [Enterococcus caccae ATCC BAA-1240]EOT67650.1 hypothetical protein I580_00032 [Enterococcus caccae ATCC BAA-1240]OJG24034.1 hypothetical protein RU98_GL001750 [Enterococcus caccae]